MIIITEKRCPKCGQTKPTSDFGKNKQTSNGLACNCKACHNLRGKVYYQAHQAQVIERTSKNNKANRARCYQAKVRWQNRHREEHLASTKERVQRWREQNRDKDRAASLRWSKAHPDAVRAISHKGRTRRFKADGFFTKEEWQAVKQAQGYRCLHCGKQEPEIKLTVDHIIPLSKGGTGYISNVQGLCRSCNSVKGVR